MLGNTIAQSRNMKQLRRDYYTNAEYVFRDTSNVQKYLALLYDNPGCRAEVLSHDYRERTCHLLENIINMIGHGDYTPNPHEIKLMRRMISKLYQFPWRYDHILQECANRLNVQGMP